MDLTFDQAALAQFITTYQNLGPPLVFLLAAAESLVLISLFIPATVLLLALAVAVGASGAHVSIVSLWLAAGFGASAGYAISYAIGAVWKSSIDGHWPFRKYPAALKASRSFFERYGLLAVFLGHFVGPARAFVPVIAGAMAVPPVRFQIVNVLSSFMWAGAVMLPAHLSALGLAT